MINLLQHTRRPDIHFNRNGKIRLSAKITRTLSLQSGDSISIAFHNNEFLLHAMHHSTTNHLATCRPSKRGSRNFIANSTALVKALFNAAGINTQTAAFPVGDPVHINGKSYLPIITKHPL